ncbi:MAG: cbb3-type cytochrome c oxidase N-terminal domain-containing protein [Sediminibacterium sp.]
MFKMKYAMMTLIAFITAQSAIAQTAQSGMPSKSTNYIEYLILGVAVLLIFVIWLLSSVLILLSKKVVELSKQNKVVTILLTIIAAGFSQPAIAQNNATIATDSTTQAIGSTVYYGGLSSVSFWTLSTVMALELFVIFIMLIFIHNMWRIIYPRPIQVVQKAAFKNSWVASTWANLDKKFFTKAAPIEKEADIMLDHDYDGIKELDNALPPWWKYGFYITIFVAIFYILKFEVWHTGMNPTEEYNTEMAEAKLETDQYLASMKENVDENSVVMLDAAGIQAGKTLFTKTCVACHSQTGGGGVGPNLTDNYTIHGARIEDIFKTIKYGYPDKGMQSWQSNFSPVEMQQLSSYIKSLSNTNVPNGKAPQGDLIIEEAAMSDSTKGVIAPSK